MTRDLTKDSVIEELGKIAFADIGETFENGGLPLSPEFVAKKLGAVASSVKFKTAKDTCEIEVKLIDKLKALELCARYLGIENADSEPDSQPLIVNYDYSERDDS